MFVLIPPCVRRLLLLVVTLSAPALAQCAVVINEIHYNPDVKTEPAEFIELYNTGSTPMDMSGWRLDTAVSFTFPIGTVLGPGKFLVVAQNPQTIASKYWAGALGPWIGSLNNEGDHVRLLNAAGAVEDSVRYGFGFPWPTVGDSPGYSIELINPSFDNDLGGNWRASVRGTPGTQTATLIPAKSQWRYFKGLSEPPQDWRSFSFDDSGWATGTAPIGYDPSVPMGTVLDDMRYNYTTVYFRKMFVVEDVSAVTGLTLKALYDDGFKLWINGQPVNDGSFNFAAGEQPNTATAGGALENSSYSTFTLESPRNYLVTGTNILAVQAANSSLGNSSDFYVDLVLESQAGPASAGPTPGAVNSVFAANAPPQVRQVEHHPKQPKAGEPVTITAKVTDVEPVRSVTLEYQVVPPGAYIRLSDAAYQQNWVSVPMNDSGTDGDAHASDSIYTAVIPASVQAHRRLIRYRITTTDSLGASVRVPYADDPQPNFAYFCYNGVPAWQAGLRSGDQPTTFGTNIMQRLPAIHLLSTKTEVENSTWFQRYGGDAYPYTGTLVYDGEVYDHIHFRARGGVWRYAMVKNMWKFDLNAGHDLQMRDDYGRQYKTKWTKLNLGACIQQGDYGHRGEQGMFESVGFKLFNLAGVASPRTTFIQFRVVDDTAEAASQYEGDFWGLYLAVEQENGRFLDEHDLPDGNFYKMESYTGELNNIGPQGPLDKSDLNAFLNTYRNSGSSPSETWWRQNLSLSNYFSYQSIVQAIHHYDICDGKNYFYYLNPASRLWSIHSWDLDLTWADNMYRACGGMDDLYSPVFGGGGHPAKPGMTVEFKNRVREIADLLYNTDQAWQIIDEHAYLLRGSGASPNFLDADRFMWDYNPKMANAAYSSSPGKAGQGRFYQWPYEPNVTKDFNGAIQLMKNYVVARGSLLASLAADSQIPARPTVNYVGSPGFPVTDIRLMCSDYSGMNAFAGMKWRVGEIWDPQSPAYDPTEPRPYEITAVWESPELTQYSAAMRVPASALKVGHAYRARVRVKDVTGRWSAWSAPVQFYAGAGENAAALVASLKISELMVDPPGGSSMEYIELRNASDTVLDLEGAVFTSGISYNFPAGATIPPLGYLLVIQATNQTAFRSYYNLGPEVALAGPYSGNLANDGEQLTLKTSLGGSDIFSFRYGGGQLWQVSARGAGHSLVPLVSAVPGQASGALDYPGNWRASAFVGGSPGAGDPVPAPPSILINEVMVHTDYTDPSRPEYDSNDWVELLNTTDAPISLKDWYLSDDPAVPGKWAIPAVTVPARGRISFDEVSGFHSPITSGFGLNKAGEQVLLSYLPGAAQNRVVDGVSFKGQENEVSLARYPDAFPYWSRGVPTRDAANKALLPGVVINEVMYHPPDYSTNNTQDEYVELLNASAGAVTLSDTNGAWRIDGGIGFSFPVGLTLPSGATLLLVNFNPADAAALGRFKQRYGLTTTPQNIYGPYSGSLGNRSERVALEKAQFPDVPGADYSWVVLDELVYGNQSPWPADANGLGLALQRVSGARPGDDPSNWIAATPSPGSATVESQDSDSDGMPDAWEREHGLDPSNPLDAQADDDGDGMSNLAEYRSGTDPHDASSVLQVQSVLKPGGVVELRVPVAAGRTYTVQFRGSLETGSWQKLADIPAQAQAGVVTVPDGSSPVYEARFYRVVTPGL